MSTGTLIFIWLLCDADLRAKDVHWGNCGLSYAEVLDQYHVWNDFGKIQPAYAEPQPLICWGCGSDLEKPGGEYSLAVCPRCNPDLLIQLRQEARAVCPKCKGIGELYDFSQFINGRFKMDPCTECKQTGRRQESPPSDEALAFIYGKKKPLLLLGYPRCCENGHPWGPCAECMKLCLEYWLGEDSDFDQQGNLIENEVLKYEQTTN